MAQTAGRSELRGFMKNTSGFAVLAAVGLVATQVSVNAKPKAAQAFQSAKNYSITPPAGWTTNKSGLMGTDVIFMAPPAKQYAANINVVVVPAAPGETLEKGAVQINQVLPRAMNGFKKLSQGYGTLGGVRSLSITANHKMGTPPRLLWMKQTYVLRKGQTYTFTCTALAENHAQYKAAFDAALKSVRWRK